MRVVFWSRGKDINAKGRGEERWNLGFTAFLQSEKVDVLKGLPNLRYKCNLFLDAPDDCSYLLGKKHVHFKFSYAMPELREFSCYKSGQMILASPYRKNFEKGKEFWSGDRKIKFVFLPMAYPDRFLPGNLEYGFQRNVISWASKEGAASYLEPDNCANAGLLHTYYSGLYALEAVEKLSKKADFNFLCVQAQHLGSAGTEILKRLPNVERLTEVPWTTLVDKFSKSKLNICPGGSAGSILESIFTKGLPVQNAGTFFEPPPEICLLQDSHTADRQDWVEALDSFWFDQQIYNTAWEYYQDCFQDHRTDGLRKAWKEALEIIGV